MRDPRTDENTFFRRLFWAVAIGIIAVITLSDSPVAEQMRTAAATAWLHFINRVN